MAAASDERPHYYTYSSQEQDGYAHSLPPQTKCGVIYGRDRGIWLPLRLQCHYQEMKLTAEIQ